MAQREQPEQLYFYAMNAGQEGVMIGNAPEEIKRVAHNRCRGAISGLVRFNNNTCRQREMQHIDRIVKDCDSGKISPERAAGELKQIGVRLGVPSYSFDRVISEIEMVRMANGKGRHDIAAAMPLPKKSIWDRPAKLPTKKEMNAFIPTFEKNKKSSKLNIFGRAAKFPTKKEINAFIPTFKTIKRKPMPRNWGRPAKLPTKREMNAFMPMIPIAGMAMPKNRKTGPGRR